MTLPPASHFSKPNSTHFVIIFAIKSLGWFFHSAKGGAVRKERLKTNYFDIREEFDKLKVATSTIPCQGGVFVELVDQLIKSSEDENPNLRRAVAMALGELGITSSKGALAKLLKDKEPLVKEAAIYALGKMNVVEAADLLVKLLGDDTDPRKAILRGVSLKGDEDDKPAATGSGALAGGQKKDVQTPWRVRKAAALVLCKLKPEIAVHPLVQMLGMENDQARIAALAGLGNMEADIAGPAIIELLKVESWEVRKAAAQALGKMNFASAVPALLGLMADSRFAVRVEAAIALNHIKAEETVAPLMKALKEDDTADVRRIIAIALGNFKSEEPVSALAEAARKDEAWQVRKAAVQSLGNIRSAACVAPVMEALTDAHEEVRAAAAVVYPRLIALVGGHLAD